MRHCNYRVRLFVLVCIVLFAGCAEKEIGEPTLLARGGFNAPEGPVLDDEGNLIVVNLASNIINKITPDGTVSIVKDVGGTCNGAILDHEGNLYIASTGRKAILKIATDGDLSVVTALSEGDSLRGPNDLDWGTEGRLYFTDPKDSTPDKAIGGVHYIDTDGKTRKFAGGLKFPNGIVFDLDKSHVYVAETYGFRVLRYQVNPDGSAGDKEVFFEMGEITHATYGEGPYVDGMKIDSEGNLWLAVTNEYDIWCISPEG